MFQLSSVDDSYCQGISFEVTDIHALAQGLALILVQELTLAPIGTRNEGCSMVMKMASLGTRTIEEVHEKAILLWVYSKKKDSVLNPASGIFFALTNHTRPPGLPEVNNAIELCSVLSQAFGLSAFSEDEAKALSVKAFSMFRYYNISGKPIRFFGYLIWANRLAYVLSIASLIISGLSWWVIGLAAAVWLCFGTARAAVRMGKKEVRPSWEVPAIAAMHSVALIGLYVVSLFHLLKS